MMNKISTIVIFSFFILNWEFTHAQDTVRKIELKVAPFFLAYSKFDPITDLNKAGLTITVHESALLHFSNDRFYRLLKDAGKQQIEHATVTDYRIKCIIYLKSGKTEILYMNVLGEFLYRKHVYCEPQIKKYIFDHIPEAYKEGI